jgi:hypothetical protein
VRPYLKKKIHKKRAGGVVQGVGPEFKLQYLGKKKKTERKYINELTMMISKGGKASSPRFQATINLERCKGQRVAHQAQVAHACILAT